MRTDHPLDPATRNRILGARMVRDAMLRKHINEQRGHPPIVDPNCAACMRLIRGEKATGITIGKAKEKGDTTMKFDGYKTLIAAAALALGKYLESHYGFQLPASADVQFYVVLAVFLGLRFVTTGPIAFLRKK